jgi:hypothetical protein
MPRCTHKGCGKEFDVANDTEEVCIYHPGAPVSLLHRYPLHLNPLGWDDRYSMKASNLGLAATRSISLFWTLTSLWPSP